MNRDADYVRLLSIFHYVVGGMAALCSLFPIVHLTIGIGLLTGSLGQMSHVAVETRYILGWLFVSLASLMMLTGMTLAVCIAIAGRKLSRRSSYNYCLVMGCIECVFMPFGTVLGVFTIIVLLRPGVKEMFGVGTEGEATSETAQSEATTQSEIAPTEPSDGGAGQ